MRASVKKLIAYLTNAESRIELTSTSFADIRTYTGDAHYHEVEYQSPVHSGTFNLVHFTSKKWRRLLILMPENGNESVLLIDLKVTPGRSAMFFYEDVFGSAIFMHSASDQRSWFVFVPEVVTYFPYELIVNSLPTFLHPGRRPLGGELSENSSQIVETFGNTFPELRWYSTFDGERLIRTTPAEVVRFLVR